MSTLRSQRIQILQGLQGTGYHRTTIVECLLSCSLNSESFKSCIYIESAHLSCNKIVDFQNEAFIVECELSVLIVPSSVILSNFSLP